MALQLTNLTGFSSSQVEVDPVVDGLVAYWDAGRSNSYSGSGTKFANIEQTPADGSGQTAYDLTISSGTFNGSAGGMSSSEYFTNLDSDMAARTTFTDSWHKNNAEFTFEFWIEDNSGNDTLILTGGTNNNGVSMITASPSEIDFDVHKSGGSDPLTISNSSFNFATIKQVVLALDESDTYQWYQNGVALGSAASAAYSSPSTGTSQVIPRVGEGSVTKYFISRVYNKKLSAAEVLQNFNADKSRFGL